MSPAGGRVISTAGCDLESFPSVGAAGAQEGMMGIYRGNANPTEPIFISRDTSCENQHGMAIDMQFHPSLLH